MSKAIIYTDGSVYPNPGTGGYGAVINLHGRSILIKGKASPTTNNRMEMMAVLEAVRSCPHVSVIEIYSDSQYVVQVLNEKLDSWIQRGKTVQNGDLWRQIWDELQDRHWSIRHVYGHNDNYYNEVADQLANEARTSEDMETVKDEVGGPRPLT